MSGARSGGRSRPTQTAEPDDLNFGGNFGGSVIAGEMVPAGSNYPTAHATGGMATDRAIAQIVTAQKVAVKRDMARILRDVSLAAQAAGDAFYYRWEVNNRREQRKDVVEGPSIVCAMAIARLYGNCAVRAIVADETQTHWTFAAEFVDYETGFTTVRNFQQRKNQSLGMKDVDRGMDMVFQIGQSKAIRNVVVNALGPLADFAVEEAKKGLLEKIGKDPAKATRSAVRMASELGIDGPRIERVVGRPLANWTVTDIAMVISRLQSVRDGFSTALDAFPLPGSTLDDGPAAEGEAAAPAAGRGVPTATPVADPEKPQQQQKQEPPAEPPGEIARDQRGDNEQAAARLDDAADPFDNMEIQ